MLLVYIAIITSMKSDNLKIGQHIGAVLHYISVHSVSQVSRFNFLVTVKTSCIHSYATVPIAKKHTRQKRLK